LESEEFYGSEGENGVDSNGEGRPNIIESMGNDQNDTISEESGSKISDLGSP
jgi:hypothetical protein